MKSKLKINKNTKAIRRVGELLQDVRDSFGWYGIGLSSEENADVKEAEPENPADADVEEEEAEPENPADAEVDEEEEEEDEEYVAPQYYFDPTDVQVAVDEAISTLIDEGLIPEFSNPKKPPKLAAVFLVLFGPKTEITEQIEYFEELISGYEDRAHIDDLREAYNILESVVEKISPKKRNV